MRGVCFRAASCLSGATMGSRCSRSPQSLVIRDRSLQATSSRQRPRAKQSRFHSSRGASYDASYFESMEAKQLGTRPSGAASNVLVASSEGPPPALDGESPPGSWWHSFATPSRSAEVPLPGGAIRENNQKQRSAASSPPGRVSEDEAVVGQLPKRADSPSTFDPARRPVQGSGMRRGHILGFHPFHRGSACLPANERGPHSLGDIDEPAREMFIEFFQRNLREQQRYDSGTCNWQYDGLKLQPFRVPIEALVVECVASVSQLLLGSSLCCKEFHRDGPAGEFSAYVAVRSCRHEEALRAAPLLSKWSSSSPTLPAFDVPLETAPQRAALTGARPEVLPGHEAEAEAVKALDLFSPDERNTRLEEFLALVNAYR